MSSKIIYRAVAVIKSQFNGGQISGFCFFEQASNGGPTRAYGTIQGLPDGLHGFHIHEWGDLTNGCTSAGAHYNPDNSNHGGLTTPVRHVGDLGNLNVIGSEVTFDFVVPDLNIIGPYSIIGRSLIIHQDPDDLGMTSNPLSKTTGNSGARIACSVIGLAAPVKL